MTKELMGVTPGGKCSDQFGNLMTASWLIWKTETCSVAEELSPVLALFFKGVFKNSFVAIFLSN